MSDVLERLRNIIKAARHGTSELVRRETLCDAVAELAEQREIRKRLELRISQQRIEIRTLARVVADQRAEIERLGRCNEQISHTYSEMINRQNAEVASLLPLALAVGKHSEHDVPPDVYRAWQEPEGYRQDEIYRLREELEKAEWRIYRLEEAEHGRQAEDRVRSVAGHDGESQDPA